MRYVETSASEPLMTYRKLLDDVETRVLRWSWDEFGDEPTSWPSGIRYVGGVTTYQALMRNVRTCRRDVKGERRASGPREAERTDARHRDGAARSSVDGS